MLASVLLALTQGLGMNLIAANLPQIQGSLGATTTEATWLVAAYMAPNVSLSLALDQDPHPIRPAQLRGAQHSGFRAWSR